MHAWRQGAARRRALAWLAAAPLVGSLALATPALADPAKWPGTKPITLVVPFPPGGTSDVIGRQLAKQLGEALKATVVVENKPGASTSVGATQVARAPKDGYTLLLSSGSTFTTTPHLMPVSYKLADFAPLGTVATVPFAFVVKKDFPAKTVAEFVALAKAKPGSINNATNGQGSLVHLLGELIASETGTQLTQVHYKGAAPATMDMIGGVVDTNVEALTSALPNVQAGKYRAIAVLSEQRQPSLPDVPTFKELGWPKVVGETWYGVSAPVGTPAPVLATLGQALQQVVASKEFGQAMQRSGNVALPGSADAMRKTAQSESAKWGALIQRLNIRLE
ncbi:hypothetical protein CCO03_01910 [Comamonas serinivorans]|uniref:ABC transporter substrate-binding protein n=1 Tax=Comamonas serinivorans TaxID=1082851 RepID=A0A1Y0EIZ0_9BURK|nr:tripartite tricarboxylate transporter substrate binding protein [Comamonas serinivorans]ARU03605.1 hypothetical protein CCO03_01910 [Comamonas serinivorans]